MTIYPYQFEAPIEKFGVGKTRKIWYTVLFLPEHFHEELPFDQYPRLRVEGEIADIPINNAFMPTGDKRYYVIIAPHILKDAELELGDIVEMRFCIADQNHVDVPPALTKTLKARKDLIKKWEALTPGKQRMLAQHVMSAKTAPTQQKRLIEALEALDHFKADLRAWRQHQKKNK
ncbi:MAG: YdeI/OmpD-associated family protein [Pseudomonadota bacterium]